MKNCIILGAGRSGTSMTAGTLADAGYYMGDTMLAATDANPKGYFEAREVETINDNIVRFMIYPTRTERLLSWVKPIPQQPNFSAGHPWARSHWLALVPPHRQPIAKPRELEAIQQLTASQPFCFKDPRFSYTLPVWRPYLQDTVFICVFREPEITATSILKEVEREHYLEGIDLTFEQALDVWTFMYRHILEKHRHQGEWLFMHYNQVLTPDGLDKIEALTGATVNRDFPDSRLQRTRANETASNSTAGQRAALVYDALCRLAAYEG